MRPNLFIIGAPKCGTSSLFNWLLMHPEIVGTKTKEPFFLIDPAHPLAKKSNVAEEGLEGYKNLFDKQDTDCSVRMEATTHYLFDPVARSIIKDMFDARVIIILREPADRVYSSFNYTANNLARLGSSLTFSRYLELVKQGKSLMPNWCSHEGSAYVLDRDIQYSRYHLHVSRWIEEMGYDRVKILLMEDMVRDPVRTVLDLLEWLKVDITEIDLAVNNVHNRTVKIRMPKLHALAQRLNAALVLPRSARKSARALYNFLQHETKRTMSVEDEEALADLRNWFEEDNLLLSAMINNDLSSWNQELI